jgi:hypothetical protein
MKKLILILLLSLLSVSCNKYIVTNLYERTYTETELSVAHSDVYGHLYEYNVDNILLENWMVNELSNDTIQITQRVIRKVVNEKSNYQFIFSEYVYPSRTYYQFVIRFYGIEKDLQK